MKRLITRSIAYVFLAVTILTGMAWYNNICMALQWDPTGGHGKVYHGPIGWLDWTAIDFSTVSTLIPFFGCLLIMVGLFRTSNAEEDSDVSENFPFFRNYNSITVALGLIGTIWGLIMIGYYDAAKVQMSDLILCLRTALYSTLVALVWVFLVVLPAKFVMQWWYRQVSGYKDEDTGDILSGLKDILNQFKGNLDGLDDKVAKLNTQLPAVKDNIEGVTGAIDNLKKSIEKVVTDTSTALDGINATTQAQQNVATEQQKTAQGLADEVKNLRKQFEDSVQQKNDALQRAMTAENKLNNAKNALG